MILKNEAVKKVAERFEKAVAVPEDGANPPCQQERGRRMNAGALSKARSKSIGHNLHQKMMVLDMERERAEGTKSQMTSRQVFQRHLLLIFREASCNCSNGSRSLQQNHIEQCENLTIPIK